MKRTAIAWVLVILLVLGAAPAFAAGPLRDEAAYPVGTLAPSSTPNVSRAASAGGGTEVTPDPNASAEPTATPDANASPSPSAAAYVPEQSILSVGGGATEPNAANTAPVVENQQIETYRGVSVGGQLTAHDPDGDTVTFEVCTQPMKGAVDISPEGYFVYTPTEGKRGKDYFGFRAVDSFGNASQEGTVIIKLIKQKTKVTYSDLAGSGSEYAALVLAENGVFTGEKVGESYVFSPDVELSRGEFLSMCMAAADCDILKGVTSTGFMDDGAIGPWLKPYVATALMNGYISGQGAGMGASFDPAGAVTVGEACVTLNAVLGVTNVVSAAAYVGEDNAEADWAQAVANLTACGVMVRDRQDVEAVLTRAGAADLLAGAIRLITGK